MSANPFTFTGAAFSNPIQPQNQTQQQFGSQNNSPGTLLSSQSQQGSTIGTAANLPNVKSPPPQNGKDERTALMERKKILTEKVERDSQALNTCVEKFNSWDVVYKSHPNKDSYNEYVTQWNGYRNKLEESIKNEKNELVMIDEKLKMLVSTISPLMMTQPPSLAALPPFNMGQPANTTSTNVTPAKVEAKPVSTLPGVPNLTQQNPMGNPMLQMMMLNSLIRNPLNPGSNLAMPPIPQANGMPLQFSTAIPNFQPPTQTNPQVNNVGSVLSVNNPGQSAPNLQPNMINPHLMNSQNSSNPAYLAQNPQQSNNSHNIQPNINPQHNQNNFQNPPPFINNPFPSNAQPPNTTMSQNTFTPGSTFNSQPNGNFNQFPQNLNPPQHLTPNSNSFNQQQNYPPQNNYQNPPYMDHGPQTNNFNGRNRFNNDNKKFSQGNNPNENKKVNKHSKYDNKPTNSSHNNQSQKNVKSRNNHNASSNNSQNSPNPYADAMNNNFNQSQNGPNKNQMSDFKNQYPPFDDHYYPPQNDQMYPPPNNFNPYGPPDQQMMGNHFDHRFPPEMHPHPDPYFDPYQPMYQNQMMNPGMQNPLPPQIVDINEIIRNPGRSKRADSVCIIIRGLPGSGTLDLANKIKSAELEESKSENVKLISIFDIFETMNSNTELNFIEKHNKSHEEILKVFNKTLDEKCHNFVIVVGIFDSERKVQDIVSKSMLMNCECFVIEQPHDFVLEDKIAGDIQITKEDMDALAASFEMSPPNTLLLDPSAVL